MAEALLTSGSPWAMGALICFAVLLAVPIYVAARRLVVRRRQGCHDARRRFLRLVRQAVANADGALLDPDQAPDRELALLDARIDPERSAAGRIWVSFPALQGSRWAAR